VPIVREDLGKESVEMSETAIFVHQGLCYHAGAEIASLLDHDHFSDDVLGTHNPGHAGSRSENLRERAGIEDDAFFVHGEDRGLVFAVEAKMAVGIVLEDGKTVFAAVSRRVRRRAADRVTPEGFWKFTME
jgi:hypothetical protein